MFRPTFYCIIILGLFLFPLSCAFAQGLSICTEEEKNVSNACRSSFGLLRIDDGYKINLWLQGQENPFLLRIKQNSKSVRQFLFDSGLGTSGAGKNMDTYADVSYCSLKENHSTICLTKVKPYSSVRTMYKDRPFPAGTELYLDKPTRQEEDFILEYAYPLSDLGQLDREKTTFYIASVDFDSSGREAYMVVIENSFLCGLNNCGINFWQKREEKWMQIGGGSYSFKPIFKLDQKTNNYHDIYIDGRIIKYQKEKGAELYFSDDDYLDEGG